MGSQSWTRLKGRDQRCLWAIGVETVEVTWTGLGTWLPEVRAVPPPYLRQCYPTIPPSEPPMESVTVLRGGCVAVLSSETGYPAVSQYTS